MPRIVKCGLAQTSLASSVDEPVETIRDAQLERATSLIERAADSSVQILCLPELFTTPYFCAEQEPEWNEAAEQIPDGVTTRRMQELAQRHSMVIIAPLFEEERSGVHYNSAAVIDADGTFLGKYRKNHIPHLPPGQWEKFYFRPGNLGYPSFPTRYARLGVLLGHDRHFPEAARELGLAGAEIVFNPSAAAAGLAEELWTIEQPAHAVANGYYIGSVNRVGVEAPWTAGAFFGLSYFCDPRGKAMTTGSRAEEALVTAEIDLETVRDARNASQFYRDRRPDTYGGLVRP